MDTAKRITELRRQLTRLAYEYYVLAESTATDAEYDALYAELEALEKANPSLITVDSPTQRIGAASDAGFKKFKHSRRMLSLPNIRDAAGVIKYLGRSEVVQEPKIDGMSLKLFYRKGLLAMALTRGDGSVGDDVTANARVIRSLPLRLPEPVSLDVVGEAFMTNTAFEQRNRELAQAGEKLLANPRNGAAGAMKLKDPRESAASRLDFVAYGLSTEVSGIETQQQATDYIEKLGFMSVYLLPAQRQHDPVAGCFTIESEAHLAGLIATADAARQALDLLTDGLVFKLNSLAGQRELGEGTKYPNYACAYKFVDEQAATRLLGVANQVGRTGQITPVAELQPVAIGGITMRRASLCNQDEIDRLNIDIGDTVLVQRSAGTIPKVAGVSVKSGTSVYKMPSACPCCGTKLVRPEGYVDLFCPNRDCDDQVFGRLYHACSKEALDLDGCGDVMVRELMAHGVRRLPQLFTADPSFMKPAARRRFEAGRRACAGQPYWRKLHALGIEGFGSELTQAVAHRWDSLAAAFDTMLPDAPAGVTLKQVVGESVYASILDYCGLYAAEIDELDRLIGMTETNRTTGPLSGKSFCITGLFTSGNRTHIEKVIVSAGGMVKGSVTSKVDYLLQGGVETGNNKKADAEKKGVKVINEQRLYEMIGRPVPKSEIPLEEKEY